MSFWGNLRSGIQTDGDSISTPSLNTNIGRGKTIYLDAANGSATGNGRSPGTAVSTLPVALAKLTTSQNDIVRLLAGASSVSLASAFDWNVNCSHLIGDGSFGRMNMRSRIGHSANFSPMFTVSGYGNSFHNLYFMHGRGSATNLVGLSITGARNSFINCHFGGPMHATEGDTSGYKLVSIASAENYFKGCVFGVDTIAWDDGHMVKFDAGGDNSQRAIFEDCIFLMKADATPSSYFIGGTAGLGTATAFFLNCQFTNCGSTMSVAVDGTGLGNFRLFFDNRCTFDGVTDVVAAAQEAYVRVGSATYTAAATSNLLSSFADNT